MTDTPLTAEELAELQTDYSKPWAGTSWNGIRWQKALATIAALTERAEQAEREVIRLTDTGVRADERREMQKAVAEAQAAEERTKRAEARVAELTAALSDLCDEQNGPPLLRDADSWQAAMNNAWRVLGRALEGTR